MRLPTYVSRLSVTNPTLYGVEVDVTSATRDGWLGLGGFPPETTRVANEVLDQGGNWIFRFSYGGQEIGQMALSRTELKRTSWRLTIPPELGDRLAAAGLQKSARG
jgi:hypothetical protein